MLHTPQTAYLWRYLSKVLRFCTKKVKILWNFKQAKWLTGSLVNTQHCFEIRVYRCTNDYIIFTELLFIKLKKTIFGVLHPIIQGIIEKQNKSMYKPITLQEYLEINVVFIWPALKNVKFPLFSAQLKFLARSKILDDSHVCRFSLFHGTTTKLKR